MRATRQPGSKRLLSIFIAIFALFLQPIVAINAPSAFAASANIDNIRISPLASTIAQDTPRGYTVNFRNGSTSEALDSAATVKLTTTSSTGQFADGTASNIWSSNAQYTTGAAASKSFRYRDSTPGNVTLTVVAEGGGLATPLSATAQLTVTPLPDSTPPSAPAASVPSGTYSSIGFMLLGLTSSDDRSATKIYYTLDGSAPSSASTLYNSQVTLGLGTTTLKAIAYDESGNPSSVSTYTYTINFSIPIIFPPVTTPVQPSNVTVESSQRYETRQGSRIAVTLSFSEAVNGSSLGQGWNLVAGSNNKKFTKIYYSTGSNTVEFTDLQGRKGSHTFTVDKTAPTVTNATQVYESRQNGRIAMTLTFSEAIDAASLGQGWYEVEGSNGTKFTKVYYSTKEHTITFIDRVGNPGSYTFTIDRTAPNVPVITSLPTGDSPTISGTAEPGAIVTVTIADRSQTTAVNEDGSWSLDFSPVLEPGDYSVTVFATDLVGNRSDVSQPANFTVAPIGNGSEDDDDEDDSTPEAPIVQPSSPIQTPFVPTQIAPLELIAALVPSSLSSSNQSQSSNNNQASAQTAPQLTPSNNAEEEGSVLGERDERSRSAVIRPSEQGWMLFGIAWYWIFGVIALLAAFFLVIRALLRRRSDASL